CNTQAAFTGSQTCPSMQEEAEVELLWPRHSAMPTEGSSARAGAAKLRRIVMLHPFLGWARMDTMRRQGPYGRVERIAWNPPCAGVFSVRPGGAGGKSPSGEEGGQRRG